MFCTKCGQKIADDAKFCTHCGHTLEQDSIKNAASPEIKMKKGLPRWLKIVAGLVIFIAAVVGLAFWATGGMVEVAESQLEALRSGDIAKAYSYTSKDFQAQTSLEQFKQFVEGYPALSKNKSASFSERSFENNIGGASGSLIAEDGGVTPIRYQFVKENDAWKILNITFQSPGAVIEKNVVPETPTMEFVKIDLGVKQDDRGVVSETSTSFSTKDKVHASIYIRGGIKGVLIASYIKLLGEGGGNTEKVTSLLEENGDTISMVTFTPPTQGWPKGAYEFHTEASNGLQIMSGFQVK